MRRRTRRDHRGVCLDPSVRGAHLDQHHGFFNGTCMFLEVVGQSDVACHLDIQPPTDAEGWNVVTSLRSAGARAYGFGRYSANDYAELIDHPVEMGPQLIREFEVAGLPHVLAIRGDVSGDVDRLVSDLTLVLEEHHRLLGTPDDLDRYVFLLRAPVTGYGGLEHRWSSANICSRDSLPIHGEQKMSDGYRQLLGLLSHEYFHLWNIKRLRPVVFTPYKLDEESYTRQLWVFEGITSYYDDLALLRSGVIDTTSYFELIAQSVTRVLQGAGRKRQSVAESSFDAWTKFYKQDANGPNAIVSYYAKGSLIALALDLYLRTHSAVSLDLVLRTCFDRYADVGLPEDGFETVCKEVSGLDLDDFFADYVYGTEDPPLAELLEPFGVQLNLSPPGQVGDKGGKPVTNPLPVAFGAVLNEQNGRTIVQIVATGGAAERAGLAPQDDLLAIGRLRVTAASIERRLRDFAPGDATDVAYFRDERLFNTRLAFEVPDATVAWFELSDETPDARKAWLSSASA